MIVMTEGLKALAGEAMRYLLVRFTRSPVTGVLTGAATTAILQSSSATTVAAVGFVGAGLMTFPAALGLIFGANLGTTLTGWLVVLFGFKLNFGSLMLPVILLGAIMRLFARTRLANIGFALAGFGLIFVGIDLMQQGMAGLEKTVTPASFPADTLVGRLQLVAIGIAVTMIIQSSSAGIAAALTAVYAGTISFEQAAALVIGMDVGTTVTAALATIGGSVGSRRTGLSHVIYNLFTGVAAIFLLSVYTFTWEALAPGLIRLNPEIALVGFHSSFNIIGVIAILPLTHHFARLMERIVPDRGRSYTRVLDKTLLNEPAIALTTAQSVISQEFLAILNQLRNSLDQTTKNAGIDMRELDEALEEARIYLDEIHLSPDDGKTWEQLLGLIHSLDHMQRLRNRIRQAARLITVRDFPELDPERAVLLKGIDGLLFAVNDDQWQVAARCAAKVASRIGSRVQPLRASVMETIASGKLQLAAAGDELEAIRWLQRVSIHIDRITHHLAQSAHVDLEMAVGVPSS
jgi:phosphate:Na+ symporter